MALVGMCVVYVMVCVFMNAYLAVSVCHADIICSAGSV